MLLDIHLKCEYQSIKYVEKKLQSLVRNGRITRPQKWYDDVDSAKSVKCSARRTIKASVGDSELDELYRIANSEILPTTKLYELCGICDIDEDSFDFTYTGTAFGAYLTYTIYVGISSSDIDFYRFMRSDWDSMFPDISMNNLYGNYVQVQFNVYVNGDNITAEIAEVDVYEHDTYSDYYSKKFKDAFDTEAFERYIKDQAESAVYEIKVTLSQYEPDVYDDIESSTKVTAARDTTVDKEAVRELVLYITNKSDLYPQVQSIVKNMQRKIKQGKYDDELAVKAWQYLADAGVEKYDKEFGSGNGTKSMLNKATREQIARELRDYFADEVNDGVEASQSVTCSQDISGSNLITL